MAGIGSIGVREAISLVATGTSNASVQLDVLVNPGNLVWSGTATQGVPGAWNVATTRNWINTSGGTADYFYNNDAVTFNDSGATGSVTLAADVSPASVTFANNSLNYTISGAGSIEGTGGLSKSGTAAVVLADSNGNDYSGATSIAGGTLVLASSNAVHDSSVAVNVNNGLAFTPGVGTFVLAGLSGSGALALSDTAGGAVALWIGGNGGYPLAGGSTFSGAVTGNGSLTKTGGGLLSLDSSATAYTGNTTVSGGTLQFFNARDFSNGNNPGNSFSIAAGSVLEFYADNSFTTTDGANQLLGTWQGGGSVISGNGTFRKTGNGILASGQGQTGTYLTFALSNSGLIDIEGGTLRNGGWQDTVWTGNRAAMYIAAGATFDVWDGNPVFIDALNGPGTITKQQGSGGTVTLNVGVAGGSGTFSGVIQNPTTYIALVKAGAGLQVLSGNNTYTGPTTISGGTLQVGNGAASGSINSTSAITNNATLVFNRADVSSVTASISGSGNVVKSGPGTIILTSSNTYTGSTSITGGVLQLQVPTLAAAGAGTPLIWFDPSNPLGSIVSGGTLAQLTNLGSSGAAGNATLQSGIAPPTPILFNGAFNSLPTLHFSGSQALGGFNLSPLNGSSYTVIAVEGKAAAANVFFLGTNASATNQSLHMGYRSDTDFTLGQYANDLDYTSAPSYGGAEVARTWAGELNTSSGHTLYLNGSLVASNTNTTPLNSLGGSHYGILGAGPAYVDPFIGDLGEVMIFNSALSPAQVAAVQQYLMAKWTQPDILPEGTPVSISGSGTLDLHGATQTIGSLTSSDSTTAVLLGGGQLTVGGDDSSTLFAGSINGAGNLVKVGPGMLTLTGSNGFTGATGVQGGTLQIGNGGSGASLGNSSGILDNGTLAFDIAGHSSISAPITGDGALVMTGDGTLVLSGSNTYTGGTTVADGTLVLDGEAIAEGSSLDVGDPALLSLLSAPVVPAPAASSTSLEAVTAVPEPGTIALFLVGGLWMTAWVICRRGGATFPDGGRTAGQEKMRKKSNNFLLFSQQMRRLTEWLPGSTGNGVGAEKTLNMVWRVGITEPFWLQTFQKTGKGITMKATSLFGLVFSCALTTVAAMAADVQWSNTGSGDFNVGSNWAGGSVPGSGNNASIANGGTATISANVATTPDNVYVGNNGGNGTLVQTGGILNYSYRFSIAEDESSGGGTGVFNMSGGSLIKSNGNFNDFVVGDYGNSNGIANITNGADVNLVNNCEVQIGQYSSSTGVLNLDSSTFSNDNAFIVGYGGTSAGTLTMHNATLNSYSTHGGSFEVGGDNSGGNASSGVLNMSGSSVINCQKTFQIGYNNNDSGIVTLHDTSSLNVAGYDIEVGNYGYGSGTLNVHDSASVICGYMHVGYYDNTTGVLNIDGGTITSAGMTMCETSNGTAQGTVNQSGGLINLTSGNLYMAQSFGTSATYNLNGGTINMGNLQATAGVATFTQSGGLASLRGSLQLGINSTSQTTYNLDGGTVQTTQVTNGSGNGFLYFNGGVLQATAGNTSFMPTATSFNAYVQAGAAIIDTNGNNIQCNNVIATDPALLASSGTDGGLIKRGAGKLGLTGNNSYNGPTTVNAGTLLITGNPTISGSIAVSPGATLGTDTALPAVTVGAGGTFAAGYTFSNLAQTGTAQPASLTTASGGILAFKLSNSTNTGNDQIDVAGNMSLANSTVINISQLLNNALSLGTYPLILAPSNSTAIGSPLVLDRHAAQPAVVFAEQLADGGRSRRLHGLRCEPGVGRQFEQQLLGREDDEELAQHRGRQLRTTTFIISTT